ncbi:hypothetical protein BC629DRAFT_1434461 [Irpex lacteus]|nr:hypothetical protein BC629DRAFT_1434461 [Irpex lacteus]
MLRNFNSLIFRDTSDTTAGGTSRRTTRSGTRLQGDSTVSVVLTERTSRSHPTRSPSADVSASEGDRHEDASAADQSVEVSNNSNEPNGSDDDMYTDEEPRPISRKRPVSLSPELGDDADLPSPKAVRGKAIREPSSDKSDHSDADANGSSSGVEDESDSEPSSPQGKGKAPALYVSHKFNHPGLPKKGRKTQPDDSDPLTPPSSPKLSAVPTTPSPKKRTSNSTDKGVDFEPMTPVSRLTRKIDTHHLATPVKTASGSSRGRARREDVMQDMSQTYKITCVHRFAVHMTIYRFWSEWFCEASTGFGLTNNFHKACRDPGDMPVWHRGCCHVKKDSEQERALVKIVTTPQFGPLIYNPARADWRNFVLQTPPDAGGSSFKPRPFIAHIDHPEQRMCGIFFGGVHKSRVTKAEELGSTGNMAKSCPLSPTCLEWPRAFNYYGHLLEYEHMYVQAWDGSISFMTKTMKKDESQTGDRWSTNPFMSTAPKSARTTQGVRSVDYRTVNGDRTADLNSYLSEIITKNGLACNDKVPVYNMTSHYGHDASVSDIQTPDMFLARMADAPLWDNEIPEQSFVAVLGLPFIYDRHRMNNARDPSKYVSSFALSASICNLLLNHDHRGIERLRLMREMLSVPTQCLRYIMGMLIFITLYMQCTVHTVRLVPHSETAQCANPSSTVPHQGLMIHTPLVPTLDQSTMHDVPDFKQPNHKVDILCPVITSTVNLLVSNADLVRPGTKSVKPVPLTGFDFNIWYAWFTPMRNLRAMDSLYEDKRRHEQDLLVKSMAVPELVTVQNDKLLGGGISVYVWSREDLCTVQEAFCS